MATISKKTITKKELMDRIADDLGYKRILTKEIIQAFLDAVIEEMAAGNRLEFRDFGVFDSKVRASRQAQNPKTLDKVFVPPKRSVKFKVGRVLKRKLDEATIPIDEATGLAVEGAAQRRARKNVSGDGLAQKEGR